MKRHEERPVFRKTRGAAILLAGVSTCLLCPLSHAAEDSTQAASGVGTSLEQSLEVCLDTALEQNHRRPASKYAVAMAEAQHRQALAGYWPQLTVRGGFEHLDESQNFLFPAKSISIPGGGTIPITFPTPGGPVTVPVNSLDIPAQDVKLSDPDSFYGAASATWLLYDGGMRRGYREQTKGLVDIMKEEARRTDLEIIDSVKRYYFGAVLARQLHQVGNDTLARMEATLNLTETMYKEGSGRVNKTDFLDNKVMVESLRSMVALLEKNEAMAEAALANTMGLSWSSSVRPADKEVPFTPSAENLASLVSTAYQFSPDWARVDAGIRAAEGAVRTAKSGYYPKVAVTGELHKWWNDYDAGMATGRNKEGWSVGVGVEIPIFNGFLTRNKIAETRARVAKIQSERILLQEGLGLQVRDLFLGLHAAEKAFQATLDAMKAAGENRDLNTRAYQNELVETDKVIRAQLVEALMTAQHLKTRYDHVALQAQLDLVVGREVVRRLE